MKYLAFGRRQQNLGPISFLGVKSKVACISGICFPLLEPGDMTKACTAICGKESCIDAVALSYY